MKKTLENLKLMKNHKKTTRGITLISIVIVIIVILILIGVLMAVLIGNSGMPEQIQNDIKLTEDKAVDEDVKAESNPKKILEVMNLYVDKNTVVEDEYDNTFIIPEGFKVKIDETTDNASTVNKGIVIEDREGNQFVWIPVGIFNKDENGTKEEIKLGRYIFDSTGEPSEYKGNYTEDTKENHNSSYKNTIAKDITAFIEKANSNHGYYIGRYEAGVTNYNENKTMKSNLEKETNWTGYVAQRGKDLKLVCKSGEQPWNYVTQNKAAELAKGMYEEKTYESDLINSYAWDTAIVFIQKCGTKINSQKYSIQKGMLTNIRVPSKTGTGILASTNDVDEQCNIFDMSGNTGEWSTETSNNFPIPCVYRGGNCSYNKYSTRYRNGSSDKVNANDLISFRPILYL